MATLPRISVVIPAYDAADTIDRCLAALAHQTLPREQYEVIVVDDGSRDGTRRCVQAHAGVRLLTTTHAGPAAARNLGVRQARGELLLFTDADCEPAPDWIERLVAPLNDPSIAGAKGAYWTRQTELVARFAQAEYEDKYARMERQPFVDFVDTYAAAYRRDLVLENGGFDPVFPVASVEDQDLSFRLAKQGHRMLFVPQARVTHWGHPRTLCAYARRKFRIGYWKVLVGRRHPGKLLRDSHTPQLLKGQILLAALGGLTLAGFPFWPFSVWALAAFSILFLLTTLPFCVQAWRKDPEVALASPALLLLRALALGTGFAAGLVAHFASPRRYPVPDTVREPIRLGAHLLPWEPPAEE